MEEIYTLAIKLESGAYADSAWTRVIELPEETNLFELHLYIQKIIEFDDDHLFEFYVGKSRRKRERIFADADEDDWGLDEGRMEGLETKLNEIYPIEGSKLYYHFDFGDSWLFQITKGKKKKSVEKGVEYPRVIESEGENPEQYPAFE